MERAMKKEHRRPHRCGLHGDHHRDRARALLDRRAEGRGSRRPQDVEMLADEERRHKVYLENHYSSLIAHGQGEVRARHHDRERVESSSSTMRSGARCAAEPSRWPSWRSPRPRVQGGPFYRDVAQTAEDEEIWKVFHDLAWEEDHHKFLALEK
jgi:hypothetical protein